MSLPNLFMDNNRALTFSIGDRHFGIDVKNILAFTDSFTDIKSAAQDSTGFIGYLDYRETLVQVFECATALKLPRERDLQEALISELNSYQQAHIDWVDALTQSITEGKPFTKARDPRMCDFGKWYYSFTTEDEGLRGMLKKLENPHNQIHALADRLLAMRDADDTAQAIRTLEIERDTTLKNLLRTLHSIQDYLRTNIHPVVLHITHDGQTPWFSMVLDEIDEIIDYDINRLDTAATSNSQEPVDGYVRDKSGVNFMMLSMDKLHASLTGKIAATA
ncbi:CZB domain-containing protein [Marinobacterium jannaschii]|uniref:CZB domain-containing protein n=1 Tax=Marinobacterium jannaschii TaxID=64970 RepID=UPI0004885CC8|nr:CZB domain-containing protein [Marinobacterium jannaschii]